MKDDLTGQKFSKLTAINEERDKTGRKTWRCKCDCGNETYAYARYLKTGHKKSCGCLLAEVMQGNKFHEKHGGATVESKERLYHVWRDMKRRCKNPSLKNYKHYGGRGISVCKEWESDFSEFRRWAYENGYNENAARGECTIDRIDVNGDYAPNNCRWVSMKIQNSNKRCCRQKA